MNEEEELFKKNFPQFCTEKGGCLSPFYDLFEAGVEIATAELNKGIIQSLTKENAELKGTVTKMNNVITETFSNLTKAKDLILNLYNAGRDVLMCRNEELAYTRLVDAINDKRIEQFLKEV